MNTLIQINITDEASLRHAFDILHDACLDLSEIVYNPQAKTFKAQFEREFLEDPTLIEHDTTYHLVKKTSFPLAESILTLEGVIDCQIIDNTHIEQYNFVDCTCKSNKLTLNFCEDIKIVLTTEDGPTGQLNDLGLLNKQGHYWSLNNPFTE